MDKNTNNDNVQEDTLDEFPRVEVFCHTCNKSLGLVVDNSNTPIKDVTFSCSACMETSI
jgi:peptide methionine sulfoxide reductase MsrB